LPTSGRRGCGITFRGRRRWGAVIRHSGEAGVAHPVMSGSFNVPMRRRLDLLTLRAGLLEAPVAFPVITLTNIGCMLRRDTRHAKFTCTMIAGAASPLSVEDFESPRARCDVTVLQATTTDLCEAAVARPALLIGTVVRIRGDGTTGLLDVLCFGDAQAAQGTGKDQVS
jgi:hypothetical protein